VKNRLDVYHKQTAPLIEYYSQQGKLQRIDGSQDMPVVTGAILETLGLNA
jgi:adenylate kinase